ncbi:hypothetical protein ACP90_05695 [Labrenzia sp. CP4]|jgi:hypothetical protein|nr:hypothetical protein ACP90_05695 [Labrenzia sp. CP4]
MRKAQSPGCAFLFFEIVGLPGPGSRFAGSMGLGSISFAGEITPHPTSVFPGLAPVIRTLTMPAGAAFWPKGNGMDPMVKPWDDGE